jgi:hypothetical protein
MALRRMVVIAAAAALAVGTVAAFAFFDAHSHSNSDTLRPFVLTMVPAWVAFLLACRFLLARPRRH